MILHVVVWGLAGLWVLWQFAKRFQAKRVPLRLRLPQVLALAMIFCLATSIRTSAAPALTAFKVYQILISMLFAQIFMERFGMRTSLKTMLWGNTLLCIAIAACALLLPDEVWMISDFNPAPSRLYGNTIAQTGVVSVLAIVLLLTIVRRFWKIVPLASFDLFLGLLALSLMRTAYITALVFFVLVLLKRPNMKPLRRFTYCFCGFLLLLNVFGQLPSLRHYRSTETISTLGDRIGLWRYLTEVTLRQSPWFGLGYYSASRIYGPEYNPGLGTAHSMFFEVFSGGGLLSFALFVFLFLTLLLYAVRLLDVRRDALPFAVSSLFIVCALFGAMGEEIDSGPVAIGFWFSAAALPLLYSKAFHLKARLTRTCSGAHMPARALGQL